MSTFASRQRLLWAAAKVFSQLALETVDEDDLDRVVAVAQPVPRWNVWLHVASGVGSPGTQGVSTDSAAFPDE